MSPIHPVKLPCSSQVYRSSIYIDSAILSCSASLFSLSTKFCEKDASTAGFTCYKIIKEGEAEENHQISYLALCCFLQLCNHNTKSFSKREAGSKLNSGHGKAKAGKAGGTEEASREK